jgi:hypothetical protein
MAAIAKLAVICIKTIKHLNNSENCESSLRQKSALTDFNIIMSKEEK